MLLRLPVRANLPRFNPHLQRRSYSFSYDSGSLAWTSTAGATDTKKNAAYTFPAELPLYVPPKKLTLPFTPSNAIWHIRSAAQLDYSAVYGGEAPYVPPYSAIQCRQGLVLTSKINFIRLAGGGAGVDPTMMGACDGPDFTHYQFDGDGYDPNVPMMNYGAATAGVVVFKTFEASFSPTNNGDGAPADLLQMEINVYGFAGLTTGTVRLQLFDAEIFARENL